MTKKVRIENADTSSYKVKVDVMDNGINGQPDTLVKTIDLDYPTQITGDDCFITSTRYLVIREG